MSTIAEQQKFLRAENRRHGEFLVSVPRSDWPAKSARLTEYPVAVFRSRHFVCQEYRDEVTGHRLTFSRTMIDGTGNYLDGITWDELMSLKRQAGYGERMAIEFYPPDYDIVNVANMRHLWLVKPEGKLPPHWRKM
jgi:hypothetical protein